jgi:RNA polymerase sigma-B factor
MRPRLAPGDLAMTVSRVAVRRDAPAADRGTESAEALLRALTALPPGHPARPALRAKAIEAWLPLAERLASRYSGRGEPVDDLAQAAAVGLIKAVDRFDPDRGTAFLGFVIPTVVGEVKRHFRDYGWVVRVPRRLQELRLAITAADSELTQVLKRSPTVADVATYLAITEEAVLEGLDAVRAYSALSLSAPVGRETPQELGDTLSGDEHGYDLVDARAALGPAMAVLDDRDRQILALRFYGNFTQAEIADRVGLSQMHVSRLIRRSLCRLRRNLHSSMDR